MNPKCTKGDNCPNEQICKDCQACELHADFNRDVYSKDNDLGFREDLLSHAKYHKENKIIEDNFK